MILGVNEIDACILLVEDDAPLAAMIAEYLSGHGFRVGIEPRGDTAVARILAEKPDLVILDLALPGEDGLTICRRLRPAFSQPILMLTARGDDTDEVVGLELGADDYLPKPFNPRELLARIRAVLRRGAATGSSRPRFRSGGLEIDFDARSASLDGKPVVLTSYEYQLLVTLAKAAGRVLSREQLLDDLKGEEYESFDRSIDVHISKLRSKLEPNPREPRYIKTVRGVGYCLSRQGQPDET